jgi:hypothetical protein
MLLLQVPPPSPTRAPPYQPFLVSFSRRGATAVLARRHGPDAGGVAFTRAPE